MPYERPSDIFIRQASVAALLFAAVRHECCAEASTVPDSRDKLRDVAARCRAEIRRRATKNARLCMEDL